MLITDIRKLKYYGDKNLKKNIEFRAFLKAHQIDDSDLDKIVCSLHDQIVQQITCTSCANCCKELEPIIVPDDKRRISTFLDISEADFEKSYLRLEGDEYYLNRHPCPFLADQKCAIYDVRPEACRTYPNLTKTEFRSRLFQIIENYSICPTVFNVFERLKVHLQFRSIGFPKVIDLS